MTGSGMSRDVLRMMRQVKQNGVDHVVNESKSADLKVSDYRKTMSRINTGSRQGPKVLQKEKAKKHSSLKVQEGGPSIPIQPLSSRTKSLPVKTNNNLDNYEITVNNSTLNNQFSQYSQQFNQAPHHNAFRELTTKSESQAEGSQGQVSRIPVNRSEFQNEEFTNEVFMTELNSLKSPHPEQISIERGVHILTSSDADSDSGSQTGTKSLQIFNR